MEGLSGTKVELENDSVAWWPCHLGTGSEIGANCSIGALSHVGRFVLIGDNCRLQGGCYISDESVLDDDVFIGPNATILNDRHPPSKGMWSPVEIGKGAVIGGGATVVAGITIGERAVLAAGATATTSIPANEVWGGVPAKFLMSREQYESRRGNDG